MTTVMEYLVKDLVFNSKNSTIDDINSNSEIGRAKS